MSRTTLTYTGSGDPTDNETCSAFGHVFQRGVPVALDDPPAKLLTNPTFHVDAKRKHEPAPNPDDDDAKDAKLHEEAKAEGLKVHHALKGENLRTAVETARAAKAAEAQA